MVYRSHHLVGRVAGGLVGWLIGVRKKMQNKLLERFRADCNKTRYFLSGSGIRFTIFFSIFLFCVCFDVDMIIELCALGRVLRGYLTTLSYILLLLLFFMTFVKYAVIC